MEIPPVEKTIEEKPEKQVELVVTEEVPVYKGETLDRSPENIPTTYRTLTIVSMVLCGLILNIFAFNCLIPAFIYSKKVSQFVAKGRKCCTCTCTCSYTKH